MADCLSCYYESDTKADVHEPHEYVQANTCINPSGEDLPAQQLQEIASGVIELRAIWDTELKQSKCLQECQESWDLEARLMEEANQQLMDGASNAAATPSSSTKSMPATYGDDLTLGESLFEWMSNVAPETWGGDNFIQWIKNGYPVDKLFTLIMDKPDDYKGFTLKDNVIQHNNLNGDEVVCIPHDRALITQILDQAHAVLRHFGEQRTAEYIRWWYWWPLMSKDTREFC